MAKRNTFLCVIGIEQYFLKHGRYPNDLKQLVPDFLSAVPLDPFSSFPLRYVLRGDSYAVYAVAENLVDDGGTNLKYSDKEGDLGIRILF